LISLRAGKLHACAHAIVQVLYERPALLICNGPGTCLPVVVGALLCRLLALRDTRIIFCESFCRVKSLSLTGRLVYPVADRFIVHWPALKERYPKAEYLGTIC
jgi:beta-1,4-N-acetylglucosaminyltransferase